MTPTSHQQVSEHLGGSADSSLRGGVVTRDLTRSWTLPAQGHHGNRKGTDRWTALPAPRLTACSKLEQPILQLTVKYLATLVYFPRKMVNHFCQHL